MRSLYDGIPRDLPDELITVLQESRNVRIERIVSQGQSSPEGFWYDQEQSEWVAVLKGAAVLQFEGDGNEAKLIELRAGDFFNIPAHMRHRVAWTTPHEPTIWLAIHYSDTP